MIIHQRVPAQDSHSLRKKHPHYHHYLRTLHYFHQLLNHPITKIINSVYEVDNFLSIVNNSLTSIGAETKELDKTIEMVKFIKFHEAFSGKYDSLKKINQLTLIEISNILFKIKANINFLHECYSTFSEISKPLCWAEHCIGQSFNIFLEEKEKIV